VRQYDTTRWRTITTLNAEEATIAFSGDSKTFLTVEPISVEKQRMTLRNSLTGAKRTQWTTAKSPFALSTSAKWCVIGGPEAGRLQTWEAIDGKPLNNFAPGYTPLLFLSDSPLVLAHDAPGEADRRSLHLTLYDVRSGRAVRPVLTIPPLNNGTQRLAEFKIAAEGREDVALLYTADILGGSLPGGTDNTLHVVERRRGTLRELPSPGTGNVGRVRKIAFVPNRRELCIAWDYGVNLDNRSAHFQYLDAATGKVLSSGNYDGRRLVNAALLPDGKTLALHLSKRWGDDGKPLGPDELLLLTDRGRTLIKTVALPEKCASQVMGQDNMLVASIEGEKERLYDLTTGRLLEGVERERQLLTVETKALLAPDGKTLLTQRGPTLTLLRRR
jgi:hypothetical protein